MRAVRLPGVVLLVLALTQCATSNTLVQRAQVGRRTPGATSAESISPRVFDEQSDNRQGNEKKRGPKEEKLQRGGSFDGDLRSLPERPPVKRERPEREGPKPRPIELPPPDQQTSALNEEIPSGAVQALAAPSPSASFDGLDYANWGVGHPPDTNGDVGPNHYIQTINSSIGIFDKLTGTRLAAFTFDTFMSQGNFGNLCDSDNFGDPVVLYDTFEDRWVITDFAFQLGGSGNVINPPGAFQCFAVSKTGDPVGGGWNFYSINTAGGLGDYPKLGVWPDGIYMSVNMFDYGIYSAFENVRLYAFNKAQMYAGSPTVQSVSFDLPADEFTVLPANARLQTGTPPAGSPNYFASVWNFLNRVTVWKFHVDWSSISLSTLTGPILSATPTSWIDATNATSFAALSPANRLDTLYPRLMVQNQYSNIAGVESLWNAHTVPVSNVASPQWTIRYYQVPVTGGSVSGALQTANYSPDTTLNRFMPSVAVDRDGNMAIGYSTSSASSFPALRYAGRLATDPINTLPQTEQLLFQGTGTQSGNCGPSSCERWGDYSAMSLDPNGCTFWYTNEYYLAPNSLNHLTRIGAFSFPSCTPVTVGSLQGVVRNASSVPLGGATVTLGSRTTTTDANGNYSFTDLAPGTYPAATASFFGYAPVTFVPVVISSGGTTTHDFSLGTVPAQSGCFTDTSQSDFQAGDVSACDLTSTPGSIKLLDPLIVDQQNRDVSINGFAFNTMNWVGQTFTSAITGKLTSIDLNLFCAGCNGSTPNLTVSVRATTGSPPLPTGADLASTTIPGFSSAGGGYFTAQFGAGMTLVAGTRYAVIVRPVSNPTAGGQYAYVCSCTGNGYANSNPYANGQRVTSSNSGGAWAADTTSGGRDLGFIVRVQPGFGTGTLVSSTKDANPAPGGTAVWTTLSWTATTPSGSAVQFQVAASNNPNGPFNFVGPSGTPATFFTTSGASLAQFNGKRYLKYKAFLSTTTTTVTPTLQDVQVCFNNVPPATTATHTPNSVSFAGKRWVSTTSPSSPPVTITNNGAAALVFTAFNGNVPSASFGVGTDFNGTTNCPLGPGGLGAGGSCQFTFSFAPVAGGTRTATFSIATNDANMPHLVSLSGTAFVIDDPTVTATVVAGGTRLQQLQNADGGWYFRASDTSCGAGVGVSCTNTIGNAGLGLLSAYDRNGNASLLADAVQAGQKLKSLYTADPTRRPFTQDLEFLVALTAASGDSQYSTLATTWFANVTSQFPAPAARADFAFTSRNNGGLRTLAVWDIASIIRMAKAVNNITYASGLAARVIARESEWKDQTPSHRWDQCANPSGCGPADNKLAFDYTLLGMGSMLWAIHDLPGFDTTINDYRAWLLSQQDAAGSWDVGDLQITSYVGLGLGAVGGSGTSDAINKAVAFFISTQLANSGWPFSFVNGVAGNEYSVVDSEVTRAIDLLFSTPIGQSVMVTPAQLASVMFSEVTEPGSTTVVARQSTGLLPWGYKLVKGLTYDVQTSASVSGSSLVCFGSALTAGLTDVRILHKEGDQWIDRTSETNCASADSLDSFAIAQLDPDAVDDQAPQLSVTLTPDVLAKSNNKMATITATIAVSDNADPSPAITLVSITTSGDGTGNKKDDVEDAAIGTDDRSFRLRAEAGKGPRVYTIVYRATDRSGNVTEVSKTVSVK